MKPIVIALKPSIYLLTMFTGIGILVLFGLWSSPLSWQWLLVATVVICVLVARAIFKYALLKAKTSVIQVRITEKGACWIHTKAGEPQQVNLSCDSVVHPWLTTLCWKANKMRTRAVLIVPDNVDAEGFRELRVWMLWAKPSGD